MKNEMKHLKVFEGFNDRSEEICLPLGITEAHFAAMCHEKYGDKITADEISLKVEDFLNHMQHVLEEQDIDAFEQLNNFFKFAEGVEAKPFLQELKDLIFKTWDNDVTYNEVALEFTSAELELMNNCIKQNPSIFKDGLPFEGDDEIFDDMIEHDKGAQLLIKMINHFE